MVRRSVHQHCFWLGGDANFISGRPLGRLLVWDLPVRVHRPTIDHRLLCQPGFVLDVDDGFNDHRDRPRYCVLASDRKARLGAETPLAERNLWTHVHKQSHLLEVGHRRGRVCHVKGLVAPRDANNFDPQPNHKREALSSIVE